MKSDMSRFEEGCFGLFMRRGIYPSNGENEWMMFHWRMTPEHYKKRFFKLL